MKIHPENLDRFNEEVRFHFAAHRKGKEVEQIKKDLREKDLKQQAFLDGKCEIKTIITHEKDCWSHLGYSLFCNCTIKSEIIFEKESIPASNNVVVAWNYK